MNVFTRLFFVLIGVVCLAIFAYNFLSYGKLSDGHSLMLWSTVPASIMMFVGACETQKNSSHVFAVMAMLVGVFFAMLCFGIYKQSGNSTFVWLGIMLCDISVVMIMLSTIAPQTPASREAEHNSP